MSSDSLMREPRPLGRRGVMLAGMAVLTVAVMVSASLQSQLRGLAYQIPDDEIEWIVAAPDLLPIRPVEGSAIGSLTEGRQQQILDPQQFTIRPVIVDPPDDNFAVYLPYAGNDTRVFVNNVPVTALPIGTSMSSLLIGKPVLVPIPGSLLIPGNNQITIVSSGLLPATRVRAIAYGPVDVLRDGWRAQRVLAVWMPWAIAVIAATGAAIGLMATGMWPGFRNRLVLPSLLAATLAAACAAPVFALTWPATIWANHFQDIMLALAAVQLLVMIPNLPGNPAGASRPVLYLVLALFLSTVVAAGVAAVCGNACTVGSAALSQTGYVLTSLLAIIAAGLAIFAGRLKLTGAALPGLALMGIVAIGLFGALIAKLGQLGGGPGLVGETVFLVTGVLAAASWTGFVVWLFVRNTVDSARAWTGLRRLVGEQERMIRQQQRDLENEVRRRAVAEERERFARDIHDGLGGTLLSLLVRIRSGKISTGEISQAVESGLDDLRLMVDALDLQSRSISEALNTIHTRIAPHFSAAGIALDWQQEDRLTPDIARPETILNLFRILQEAATNIIRHAEASEARFSFSWSETGSQLVVHIADNGKGRPDQDIVFPATRGGLKNMAVRAERIGGVFSVHPGDPSGWTIDLRIPVG